MGITPEEASLHLIYGIEPKIFNKTERDEKALKVAVEALVKDKETAFWVKYRDIIECSACGFGYYAGDYYFKNHKCINKFKETVIFSRCPECGRKMDKEIKEKNKRKK